jgi:hypothetical protein
MGQTRTGQITEQRVREVFHRLGLKAEKPYPDRGVDLEVWSEKSPDRKIRIQIKGRNPKNDPDLRWFQIRVTPKQLEEAQAVGLQADEVWKKKVKLADFFILDAVKVDEMFVLSQKQVFEVIRLNERKYKNRPDNIFNYERPFKQKQKEINMDIVVDGKTVRECFLKTIGNFDPIIELLAK